MERRARLTLATSLMMCSLMLPACGPKLEPGESETASTGSSQSSSGGSTGTTSSSGSTGTSTGGGSTTLCNTQATSITYSAHVGTVLNSKCTPCHSQNGSHPNPDLTTYTSAKSGVQGGGLVAVDSGEMPPSSSKNGSLTKDEVCLIDAWAKGGYAQ